jgi:uncharacterized protein YgbK (DUF1537 family)
MPSRHPRFPTTTHDVRDAIQEIWPKLDTNSQSSLGSQLEALTTAELAGTISVATERLEADVDRIAVVMGSFESTMKEQIGAAVAASDRAAAALVRWTKVLAFATIALVLATAALVLIEWMH